jgi:citrate lyase subunit beta/citryl-CoA lyase
MPDADSDPKFRRRRSALYVPASNLRAIDKARGLPCDVVILDLEDAVAPEAKDAARANAAAAIAAGGFGPRELIVRVNGAGTPWYRDDLAAVLAAGPDAVLAPKIDHREALVPFELALRAKPGIALWAMIETPRAILQLDAIAGAAAAGPLACLVAGTNDLAKEAGFLPGIDRLPLLGALGLLVLAARAHGLAALDGVCNALDDEPGFARQCAQGRAFGFDGKTLIHPGQVAACNAAFTPDAAAVAAAEAVVAAFAEPGNAGKGAIRVDGQMVERLHLAQAQRTLRMAAID